MEILRDNCELKIKQMTHKWRKRVYIEYWASIFFW